MTARLAAASVMLLLAGARLASGQRVSGIVRDRVTRDAIPGAVVWLADSTGASLARVIGDAAGRFRIQRTSAAHTLHAVRIGYEPREFSAVELTSDTTVEITMVPLAALLAPMGASTQRMCPDDARGSAGLALWEQARAALLAGLVAREAQPPRVRLISYVREREPILHRMTNSHSSMKDIVVEKSYVAAQPAWAFAARGYMRELPGAEREYYAPDNETLLDATFATTHCLSVARTDRAHAGQVGIAFEPVHGAQRDSLVDISGVLWLDRAMPALRSIEFTYTGLEPMANESGGEIVFASMPNGAPIVHRWVIRTMLLAADESRDESPRAPAPRRMRTNVRNVGNREVGGEVASINWPDGTEWHAALPRITGTVLSADNTPVAGARVWMLNTSDTVSSAADGRFALPYVVPGTYAVLASDSVLTSAGVPRSQRLWVSLKREGEANISVPLVPRVQVLSMLCSGHTITEKTGVVLGEVTDSAGAPAPFAKIDLFRHIVQGNTELFRQDPGGSAGKDGRFVVCGASPTERLRIRATSDTQSGEVNLDWRSDNVVHARVTVRAP